MRRGRRRPRDAFEFERKEIDEFVERQVSTAKAFAAVASSSECGVSSRSLEVAEFLVGMGFWEREGCVRLLMETERGYLKRCRPFERERIVEEVEAKFEAYHEALGQGGYL